MIARWYRQNGLWVLRLPSFLLVVACGGTFGLLAGSTGRLLLLGYPACAALVGAVTLAAAVVLVAAYRAWQADIRLQLERDHEAALAAHYSLCPEEEPASCSHCGNVYTRLTLTEWGTCERCEARLRGEDLEEGVDDGDNARAGHPVPGTVRGREHLHLRGR